MPYATNADLPDGVRNHLPDVAQDIYRETFNSALEEYGQESQAARVAWAAVEKVYAKNEYGIWTKKIK
jgi:cation transport regulator